MSPQKHLFMQACDDAIPEDLDSDNLIPLSPNLTDEEYLFTLTDTEGITDLFDSYNLWSDDWCGSGTSTLIDINVQYDVIVNCVFFCCCCFFYNIYYCKLYIYMYVVDNFLSRVIFYFSFVFGHGNVC